MLMRQGFPYMHKFGPSHLLSENGDLSFLLFFFSKQWLVEIIQGKF